MINRTLLIATLGFISMLIIGCAGNSTQGTNAAAAGSSATTATQPGQMSLTEALVRELGVTESEAQGGAGAIMQYAKDSLSPREFSEVSNSIPGMDGLLDAVPAAEGIGGQALSSVTGAAGDLGGAAEVASAFQQLNLSPDMVNQYVPVIMNYVKRYGSEQSATILQSALSTLM